MRRALAPLALAIVVMSGLPGVGASAGTREASAEITVLAASSLTEAFTRIAKRFERRHPDVKVRLSFNASSALVTQVELGAPADVIATADESSARRLVDRGEVADDSIVVFARNRLAIAVAPGNPKGITALSDTLGRDLTLVLCAPEAPCGKLARRAYKRADLSLPEVPVAANVKDAVAKVALGEADAAVVYVTDVRAARHDVDGVRIPREHNVIATYPIAHLEDSEDAAAARRFVEFGQSNGAQRILRRFGFLAP